MLAKISEEKNFQRLFIALENFMCLPIMLRAVQSRLIKTEPIFNFYYLCSNGDSVYQSNLSSPQDLYAGQCNPNGRFAILLHGWRENCSTSWMKQLIKSKILF